MPKNYPRIERRKLPAFGEYLRSLRKSIEPPEGKEEVTLEVLSVMTGFSRSLLAEYERGDCFDPAPQVLKKISDCANVSYFEILTQLIYEKYGPVDSAYYVVLLHKVNKKAWEDFGLVEMDKKMAQDAPEG